MKPRLSVSFREREYAILARLSKRRGESIASVIREAVREFVDARYRTAK